MLLRDENTLRTFAHAIVEYLNMYAKAINPWVKQRKVLNEKQGFEGKKERKDDV